ncbi:hypothetical protein H206_06338 [Candidatus Electrothrix aarhusensis]|uniref:Uncharacterized protein n=1 Tax=Candidatus Electrothrix aarhusensis TaxID=1859131 RepID=A0A444J302_9BACT|nr:hypothetical protein H206_06338 [Candidatus Electrothrix aarhusensis]
MISFVFDSAVKNTPFRGGTGYFFCSINKQKTMRFDEYYPTACSIATATATDAPTIGLFPMPIKPIISTWAGTEEDPANWASECILPMVSVMP